MAWGYYRFSARSRISAAWLRFQDLRYHAPTLAEAKEISQPDILPMAIAAEQIPLLPPRFHPKSKLRQLQISDQGEVAPVHEDVIDLEQLEPRPDSIGDGVLSNTSTEAVSICVSTRF